MDGALGQSDNQLDVGRKYQCGLGCVVSLSLSVSLLSIRLTVYTEAHAVFSFWTGVVTAGICNLSIAASLAEFLSAYPT